MAMAEVVATEVEAEASMELVEGSRGGPRGGRGFGAGRHNNNQRGDFKKPQGDGGLKCFLDAKALAIRFRSALPIRRSMSISSVMEMTPKPIRTSSSGGRGDCPYSEYGPQDDDGKWNDRPWEEHAWSCVIMDRNVIPWITGAAIMDIGRHACMSRQ